MIQHCVCGFATSRRHAALAWACGAAVASWTSLPASPLEFPVPPAAPPVAREPATEQAVPPSPRRVPRLITLVGVDTPGDPGGPTSSADSPTESSGPFDRTRDDLGADDDLGAKGRRPRRGRGFDTPARVDTLPDPLRGTPSVSPDKTGADAAAVLERMLAPRSDSWADWTAGTEPLHECGEPRWLPPCVPPPPCHPSLPPRPYDLVGVRGTPTAGPIYRGPCQPRTGTHDGCPHPRLHRLHDRLFDWFYMWK